MSADIAKQAYADFAAKDMEAFAAKCAPDMEWTVSDGFPYGGTYRGFPEVVQGVFAKIPSDWEGFRHELDAFIDCADHVLVTGTYHGTWKPTGKTVAAPFVHHLHFRDGKIQTFRQYVDLPATHQATDGFVHAS